MVARGGLTRQQAQARLAAQLPLADKLRVATHVIDNDGDRAATEAQVDRLLGKLTGSTASKGADRVGGG